MYDFLQFFFWQQNILTFIKSRLLFLNNLSLIMFLKQKTLFVIVYKKTSQNLTFQDVTFV